MVFHQPIKIASRSISNNIAEGFDRETAQKLIRFLYLLKAAAGEVRNIINVLRTVNYLNLEEADDLKNDILRM